MKEKKPMAEFKVELKFTPCEKCGSPTCTMGSGMRRGIFYFTDRYEVRCKECGYTLVFEKGAA